MSGDLMDGKSYIKFLRDIESCSDQRLREVYLAVVDEMDKRSWEKRKVKDAVESLSELESDWGMA
jgi:hypothetical protein